MNINSYHEEGIKMWLANKARGSVILDKDLDIYAFITTILDKCVDKNKGLKALIIADGFKSRQTIIDCLFEKSGLPFIHKVGVGSGNYIIITDNLIDERDISKDNFDIIVCINVIPKGKILELINTKTKFYLCGIDKVLDSSSSLELYKATKVVYRITNDVVKSSNLTSPVKETRIGVELDIESRKKYDDATKYITDTITIFGDMDTIDKCRTGNQYTNDSADSIILRVANNNGWSYDLDMENEYNQQRDAYYNPIALKERVHNFYNIIRLRKETIIGNEVKFNSVLDIIKSNLGKKILLISNTANIANALSDYINSCCNKEPELMQYSTPVFESNCDTATYQICYPYNNDCPPIKAINEDGKPILYKSGEKKGEVRMLGSGAQMTANLLKFNSGRINILSANSSLDKGFAGKVDIVIITSPYCNNVRELKERVKNLTFNTNPNEVYVIYAKATVEEKKLSEMCNLENDTIIEDKIVLTNSNFSVNVFVD